MSVIGIVGEYNPFHYGHKHHIEQTIKQLGQVSPVVCVMSGDFVQRGEAAVYSKFARAEAAVLSGADLVIELPLPWSLASAEGFARGAVGLLDSLGVVTHLSFGSECGDVEELKKLAELMLEPEFSDDIRDMLKADEGISFALARQRAAERRLGETAGLLAQPNNILAVEYIKYIYDSASSIKPVTISRRGAGHDSFSSEGFRSAAELRRAITAGESLKGLIPDSALEVFERENRLGRGPVLPQTMETAILSRLRMLPEEAFAKLPDAVEGLNNRLMRACREEAGLDAVFAAAKSRRYALSRIRRMTLCAALGIDAGMQAGTPPYARVLAANERGCALLREIGERNTVPVITKPASVLKLGEDCRRVFEQNSAAHDLYVLGFSAKEERKGGSDWRTSPKIVQKLRFN